MNDVLIEQRLADTFDAIYLEKCDLTIADAIRGAMEVFNSVKSFSELIIEGNKAKKTCGQCGQLCVAYREKFRKAWITCLHAYSTYGAMTYKQLANVLMQHYGYRDKAANNTARMACMARHWNVIEKTDQKINRCPVYRITEYGRAVLAGTESVAEFYWIPARGVEIDIAALPRPAHTFASSLAPDNPDEQNDRAGHIAGAAAARSSNRLLADYPF